MKEKIALLQEELESRLLFFTSDFHDNVSHAELAIQEVSLFLRKLKKIVLKHKFTSELEEMEFFKNHKPYFLSKLIYYNEVYKIETYKPHCGVKAIHKYYQSHLRSITRFREDNLSFYQYYRAKSTYMDHKYFLRKNHDARLHFDTVVFEIDHRFSTSHDFILSKMMANELIELFINKQKINVKTNFADQLTDGQYKTSLRWTDTKTALIELVYAFYYKGSFNNGNADIKEITSNFEMIFNIELGDVYRSFIDLKNRNARTKFISGLESTLRQKMEEGDW